MKIFTIFHHVERSCGRFCRMVELPGEVIQEGLMQYIKRVC